MIVTSRAPVRIDFCGAWTDVHFFARGAGGACVNATINRFVEGRLVSGERDHPALRGGDGIDVTYHTDLPPGSGLGTSSALNVCWVGLVQPHPDPDDAYRARIAELAYQLEEMLGILGGKQDQYASALGGVNFMRFGECVEFERLAISEGMLDALERRLVLCYTGKSRLSSNIHQNVWSAFRRGTPETVRALYELRDGAEAMRDAILTSDIGAFGEIMTQSWRWQKALDPSVTNDQIDELFLIAQEAGATHGKACGAGGGGCLLFLTDPGRQSATCDALSTAGARIIPFRFDFGGLQIRLEEPGATPQR